MLVKRNVSVYSDVVSTLAIFLVVMQVLAHLVVSYCENLLHAFVEQAPFNLLFAVVLRLLHVIDRAANLAHVAIPVRIIVMMGLVLHALSSLVLIVLVVMERVALFRVISEPRESNAIDHADDLSNAVYMLVVIHAMPTTLRNVNHHKQMAVNKYVASQGAHVVIVALVYVIRTECVLKLHVRKLFL